MKKIFYISAISAQLLVFQFIASAQLTFQGTYGESGDDEAYSFVIGADGSYLLVGRTTSFGITKEDIFITKVDAQGNLLWSKSADGILIDYALDVKPTPDGGYILAGYSMDNLGVNRDFYVMKFDVNGTVAWTSTIGDTNDETANALTISADGSCILAGRTSTFTTGNASAYMVKLSSSGSIIWTQSFGNTGEWAEIHDIMIASNGDIVFCGEKDIFSSGKFDIMLGRADSNGNLIWAKTFDGTGLERSYDMDITSDGGYILTGYTSSAGGAGIRDIFLIKTDNTGTLQWSKLYGDTDSDEGWSVKQSSDGGYAVTGNTKSYSSGSGIRDVLALKTDNSGSVQYFRTYGGTAQDYGYYIYPTSDKGYVIGGITSSFGNGSQMYLIKTDSTLSSGCNDLSRIPIVNTISFTESTVTFSISNGGNLTAQSSPTNRTSMDSILCFTCTAPSPTADYAYSINGSSVSFTNTSANADSYSWNFGDGSSVSNLENPIHAFVKDSTYNVCLTVSNCTGTSQKCQSITVCGASVPTADFIFSSNNLIVNFTNTTTNADSYSWEFGDGQTSNLENPSHTYATSNSYLVCFTVTNCAGNDSSCKSVSVTTSISELNLEKKEVNIYPNPFSENAEVRIENTTLSNHDLQFTIYDLMGRTVKEFTIYHLKSTISRDDLPNGIYFYKITDKYHFLSNGKLAIID